MNDTSPRNSNVVPNHSCFPQCVSYRGIEELKELNVQDLNFDIRDNTNIIINKLIFTLKNDDFYNGALHLCNSSIFYFNDRKINQLLIWWYDDLFKLLQPFFFSTHLTTSPFLLMIKEKKNKERFVNV